MDSDPTVSRVPSDLHGYRDRLEAGVELGRRNRETVQGLTEQVQRMRRKAAEDTRLASSFPQINVEIPSISDYDSHRTSPYSGAHISRVDISPPRKGRGTRSTSRGEQNSWGDGALLRHRSSPRLDYYHDDDREDIDALYGKLKSELFKNTTLEEMNELLREENDAALQANEGLRGDVTGLTKALEALERQSRNDQQRYNSENTHYRNQLENQHRQLISLWRAFTAVKRQVRDLHTTTANDLDKQKTEFVRCASLMQRAIKQAEHKNKQIQDKLNNERDETIAEVMKKHDHINHACLQAEKALEEKTRQLRKTDNELKRLRDDHEEIRSQLERIDQLPELNRSKRRTRSTSPGPASSVDVTRKIRTIINAHKDDIRQLEDEKEKIDNENRRLKRELDNIEKERHERKEIERKSRLKKEDEEHRLKDAENELKRLKDRLALLMEEKDSREQVITQLQESIASTHRTHKEFIEQITIRHRTELDEREELHKTELEGKTIEDETKIKMAEEEVERYRSDLETIRQQLREAKADLVTAKKSLEDKDFTILNLEEDLSSAKKRTEQEMQLVDEKERIISDLRITIEDRMATEAELRTHVAEEKSHSTVLEDEVKSLHDQLSSLRIEISHLQEKLDHEHSSSEELQSRIQSQESALTEAGDANRNLKKNIHDLELKLESTIEEAHLSQQELSAQREIVSNKVQELNDTVRHLEELKREKDILTDELNNVRQKLTDEKMKFAQLQNEFTKKQEEDHEQRSLLEDLRANFDRLTNENHQKEITIEDLKTQIEVLNAESQKQKEMANAEKLRDDETAKFREKEIEDNFATQINAFKAENKSMKDDLDLTKDRLKDLTLLHEKLMEEELNLRMQVDEAKESLEDATSKYKKDIERLTEQITSDREEWEDERKQLEKSKASQINELKDELEKADNDLREAVNRELALKSEIDQLNAELEINNKKMEEIQQEKQDHEEYVQLRTAQTEEDRRSNVSKVEELHLQIAKMNAQLDEAERKRSHIEKDLSKSEQLAAKRLSQLNEMEKRLGQLSERLREKDEEEQEIKDRLALMEKESHEAKTLKERSANRLVEEQKRVTELEEKLRELGKEVHNARNKTQREEEVRLGKDEKVTVLTNRVKQLEIQLADRQAKSDSTTDLVKKMEGDGANMAHELRKEKDITSQLKKENDALSEKLRSLHENVENLRSALDKKTLASKHASNELIAKYREAEKRFVDRETECEQLRGQIATLNVKIERIESRKTDFYKRAEDQEARNAELTRRLLHYERSAKMALNLARSTTNLRPGTSTYDLQKTPTSGLGESLFKATSSQDISIRSSPERAVHFDDEAILDMSSSMEITLRYLKERIAQLERDKRSLQTEAEANQAEAQSLGDKLKEATTLLTQMESKLSALQQENHQLESTLSSQRQLYLSSEETARSRETEQKNLKAKLATADMHLREKDGRINLLNGQLETLRIELSTMQCDKQKLLNAAKATEEHLRREDEERRELEDERNRFQRILKDAQNELKSTNKRLEETESERSRLARALEDVERTNQRDRDLLAKLQSDERHWRLQAVSAKKSSEDYHKSIYEQRIANLQASYDSAIARNNAISNESDKLRQELRDYTQRVSLLNGKIAELERRTSMEKDSKTSIASQLAAFQRAESEWNKLEKDMRNELQLLRKDKLSLLSEVEDLKRRIMRSEVERKEIEGHRSRLDREVAALKKHLHSLEEDKTRTDTAVRETLAERKAIDKSLAAMERENAELYRNCGLLQTQIQNLEKDSGQRTVTKLMKDQTQLESRISKLMQEKRQLELVIEQKESNYIHKRKLLESQISLLREQLEAERRRRLGRMERDTRINRQPSSSTPQRQKSPFRFAGGLSEVVLLSSEIFESKHYRSRSSTFTNDTSTSIETTFR